MTAPWLRLDAAVFSDHRIRDCRPWGATVWIAILTLSRAHGWGGDCPASALRGDLLADYIGWPQEMAGDIDNTVARLKATGLLHREGETLRVLEWNLFQADPTNAERQARWKHRKRKELQAVTGGNGGNAGNGTDVQTDRQTPSPTLPRGGGGVDSAGPEPPDHGFTGLLAVVAEVVGPNPREWSVGLDTWARQARDAEAAGVTAEDLRGALRQKPSAKPWEVLDPLRADVGRRAANRASLDRAKRAAAASLEEEAAHVRAMKPERRAQYLEERRARLRPNDDGAARRFAALMDSVNGKGAA